MSVDFLVRPCQSLEEARFAQELDNKVWKNGFQHYEWLYNHDQNLLLVAVEKNTDNFLGYVGVERFNPQDFEVGVASGFKKSMPPWNHDGQNHPKGVPNDGSIVWIRKISQLVDV